MKKEIKNETHCDNVNRPIAHSLNRSRSNCSSSIVHVQIAQAQAQ